MASGSSTLPPLFYINWMRGYLPKEAARTVNPVQTTVIFGVGKGVPGYDVDAGNPLPQDGSPSAYVIHLSFTGTDRNGRVGFPVAGIRGDPGEAIRVI